MFDDIVSDPAIFGGKPVIRGTRISVEFVLELVASGGSVAEIVRNRPFLSESRVRQAVLFAAGALKTDAVCGVARPATTRTPEEKARRRAARLLKRREELRCEMREDVAVLRRIIRGTGKQA